MKVLLSIKPEFVQKIFSGEKRFEFRKSCREICYETMKTFRSNNLKKPIIRFEEQANVLQAVAQLYIAANTPSFEKKKEKINYYGELWDKSDA